MIFLVNVFNDVFKIKIITFVSNFVEAFFSLWRDRGKVGNKGYYLDLKNIIKYIDQKDHQYSSTPSLSHMFALDFQLDRIEKEGIENRFIRHTEMAEFTIDWANKHFKTFPKPGFESMTVTCINNTIRFNFSDLNKELGKRGMQISDRKSVV